VSTVGPHRQHPYGAGRPATARLLVLPFLGFLCNTWLGALVGVMMHIGSRRYAPAEEAVLAKTFGVAWTEYRNAVKLPWL
jgi:protein-S-isoprenylcysteine O-methyltransferase Ste14